MPCPARRTYEHILDMLIASLLAGHYGSYMKQPSWICMARTQPGAGTLPVHNHPLPSLKPTAALLLPGSMPAALRLSLAPPSSAGNTMQSITIDGCCKLHVATHYFITVAFRGLAWAFAEMRYPGCPPASDGLADCAGGGEAAAVATSPAAFPAATAACPAAPPAAVNAPAAS